jgi:hypothetical protein
VFAWLWKASDPVPINTGDSQVLAGNGTEAEGGGTNVTEAVSVKEAAKENHDAAKKELALSQDKVGPPSLSMSSIMNQHTVAWSRMT